MFDALCLEEVMRRSDRRRVKGGWVGGELVSRPNVMSRIQLLFLLYLATLNPWVAISRKRVYGNNIVDVASIAS